MGTWGEGVWQNDEAADFLDDLCAELMKEARSEASTFEDAVEVNTILARVDAVAALCINAGSSGGESSASVDELKWKVVGRWTQSVPEDLDVLERDEWQGQIEKVFDRLITHLQENEPESEQSDGFA
jgi:hypothetical protein